MFTLLDFDSRVDYQPRNVPGIVTPPPAAAPAATTPAAEKH
jgi:hypothetical protein